LNPATLLRYYNRDIIVDIVIDYSEHIFDLTAKIELPHVLDTSCIEAAY